MKLKHSLPLGALTGIFLSLAQPGAGLAMLAPFALTPVLMASANEYGWQRRFLIGWLAGFLQWAGTCYWIRETLAMHGGMPEWLAGVLWILFALAKGLHMAVFASVAGPIFGVRWSAPVVALLWVGLERTHAYLGFTWLHLGNAGVDMEVPMRLAPWVGAYGLSFVFALMSATMATYWLRRERVLIAWCAPLLALYLLPGMPAERPGEKDAVALQPNLPEQNLLDPDSLEKAYDKMAQRTLGEAFSPSKRKPSLLLWPEVPQSLYYEKDPAFREMTGSLARLSKAPFLFGTVRFDDKGNPYNTAQMLTSSGDPAGTYDKMNLVPFGEYVPPVFNALVDKVSKEAGTFQPGREIAVFPTPGGKLGVFICYESAFSEHVREITRRGADVLVNLTNDGYFGRSWARDQHLAIARMRAAENARWVLRPTNDGYTAAIDPAGRVVTRFEPYRGAAGRLPYSTAITTTFYTKNGDWFAWMALGLSLGLSVWIWRRD